MGGRGLSVTLDDREGRTGVRRLRVLQITAHYQGRRVHRRAARGGVGAFEYLNK